ncbi:MAG: DUF7768 domain-containing protein [Desulfitobacteriaceae bacterium]
MKVVYICSPLRGDIERNIRKAQGYCRFAVTQGVVPLAPHMIFTQLLDDEIPEERAQGLLMGLELLKHCSEVYVFGHRVSDGMQSEINAANQLGYPN